MTVMDASKHTGVDPAHRRVIFASSLGTVFEWYDFYLYGALSAIISRQFFSGVNETTGFIFALLAFAAGFFVRPFGALVFGRLGDLVGRKHTFLVTIVLMGVATAGVGLLPSYETIGVAAPILLIILRLLQGLALGGEYGGAATYVAEHAPDGKRGQYTSWIQASVAGGFLLAVVVVLITRQSMSNEAFEAWGWRVPFLTSILLLAISLFMRLKLSESPVFKAMKAAGTTSKNPFVESFKYPGNIGRLFVALFGVAAGLTVIYYTSQFGTLYFLTGTARVPETDALLYMAVGAALAAPTYVACGWLSDKWGRKRMLLLGYGLSIVGVFPIFWMMADAANPALARATVSNPVTLSLPACDFNVLNRTHETECAQALNFLTKRGIAYSKQPSETLALTVGESQLQGFDEKAYVAALEKAGYPDKSDPAQRQPWKIILAVFLMVALSGMTYGQVAAILVEMFPAKIRYTSMSIPYHIGAGYFGGFLPYISQYIVAQTGQPFSGLWYTVGVTALAFVVALIWLPETSGKTKLD